MVRREAKLHLPLSHSGVLAFEENLITQASRSQFYWDFFFRRTSSNVAIGPMNKLAKNQPRPLRFLLCASPALMSASVPQPTKNPEFDGAFVIIEIPRAQVN
jgi:hypothetical protein